ncbi:hypothetical protein AGMMS49965_13600 [Bacteroidia bacterium]|nr:hypothetical protein AGMMS49965_13600 [Bacteroidia bacterium]
MKKIFEYLRRQSDEHESVLRVQQHELWFCFTKFQIIIEFLDLEDDDFNDNFVLITDIDFSVLFSKEISRIYIQASTPIYEDREDMFFETSYTNYVNYLINAIKKQYPEAISDYEVMQFCIDDCGSDYGCPEAWEYGFQINIDEDYWTSDFFYNFLLNEIEANLPDFFIPPFYNTQTELKESFEVKILNTNTKIRRLGYMKVLLRMINEQSKVPISKINFKFEKYCTEYDLFLQIYKNKKGNVIVTKTGNSANPYIEMAVSLGLIHKSAGVYEVGKTGKVYNILKDKIDVPDTNPFVLSKFDTTFFLELLLKEDYWFLYAILEQTAINPIIAYKSLKKEFKSILLTQIAQFIDKAQDNNEQRVLPLKMIERRINDWKKPEVYMEHVLMPRLNWLYDMELIDLKNDLSFHLTKEGERLLFNLTVWNDIALHRIVSPISYIDNYFMKMTTFALDLKKNMRIYQTEKVIECLNESFVLFKTLAPNRVTFSLFANYTKHILFWNNFEAIDTADLKNLFESKQLPNYIYKYQEQYKDGYIQKQN